MTHPEDSSLFTRPELSDVFDAFEAQLKTNLRVALPASVITYDPVNQLIDAQPLVAERARSGAAAVPYPILGRIPVVQPRSAAGSITIPLVLGDPVLLIFSDRDLSSWQASDGGVPYEPSSTRKHELSDCWAIPGGYPNLNPLVPTYPLALEIRVEAPTKIAIHDGAGNELLNILNDLITAILAITQNTADGSVTLSPLLNASTITALQTKLGFLKP